MTSTTTFNTAKLSDNTEIFYIEAGNKSKPTILLLHGFPTSSNMFRHLIPILAPHFHLVAPDIPGFGYTKFPENYKFTFDNLAASIGLFVKAIDLRKFAMYIFDYGGPVGFRLALEQPDRITALIVQNSNAYEEGLDDAFWAPIKAFWKAGRDDPELVAGLTEYLETRSNIDYMYTQGMSHPERYDPTNCSLDLAMLKQPGQTNIQLDLFFDYQANVKLYPKVHELFRELDVPVLIAWGKNDYCFSYEGAEAYKRDNKKLIYHYVDSGHFALEDHATEIGEAIIKELGPLL
ncbi:unnamed protein product [Kuraishia capsulata CBS 1993]|uniref:AB hydrolase-1 domain-containing protein n=1 Tax=Kuraishia capsulata CBS 1993 TaxID=1382522 RepID=W6MNH0_9ASCO|nr:uncharacterized protein KUCA_T00002554001 [Kuraishia capsulata CBS 1993]CDK26582.1 unnamed protein product [Kuraishia capsulata CBS 1993]